MSILLLVFLTACVVQVIFFIAFLFSLSQKSQHGSSSPEGVTVVVCAHDEEDNLRELLPLLLAQEYTSFEVIVVNDRSNDGTYDLLLAETKNNARLRMVHVSHLPPHANGKKYGITLAIKAARHDIILLTDADCRPASTKWIQTMASEFDEGTKFVLGVSPYFNRKGFLNLFIRYETLFTALQYIGMTLLGRPYMGVGRNLAYRKSLFLGVKGFNDLLPLTGGDDDLFVNRHATASNTRVCMDEQALVYSWPKNTWRGFFNQKVRHLATGKRYTLRDKLLLAIFTISHGLFWLSGIVLLAVGNELWWAASALLIRVVLVVVTFSKSMRRFGVKFEVWTVPVLDFVFVFYYLSTGTAALITKKIAWKKN